MNPAGDDPRAGEKPLDKTRQQAFVRLDFGGGTRFFERPVEVVEARHPLEIIPALDRLRGREAAGFLSYEAGLALEPKLAPLAAPAGPADPPLLWFGIFDPVQPPAPPLSDPRGAWAGAPRPRITPSLYRAAFDPLRDHILGGDVYQANLTFQADVLTAGHPLALYAQLRARAGGGWSALVFTGEHWLLSFSPELFFRMSSDRITVRPMKGTAPADSDPEALSRCEKNRAENLMIVDLMRNDLSRLSVPGSVKVPSLFAVEAYPTVLQMTSTVTARLREGVTPVDVIKTIFPCGSVTGAPKIRAMEIIDRLEADRRGPYTGSIGYLDAGGDAAFNVAIRTLVVRDGEQKATIGLGSGVVADSEAGDEWDECLAKGRFVASPATFDLFETLGTDSAGHPIEAERHLERLEASAAALGFAFDRAAARDRLAAVGTRGGMRLRLRLSRSGAMAVEARASPAPTASPRVALATRRMNPHDFRLRHKTSDRAFYDVPRRRLGLFEILYEDEAGYLTEGSFTNLFVEQDGRLLTPPLARGLLPGILRQQLLESGRAVEAELRAEQLSNGFIIGNALRGLIALPVSCLVDLR